jgi:hypothetical protein
MGVIELCLGLHSQRRESSGHTLRAPTAILHRKASLEKPRRLVYGLCGPWYSVLSYFYHQAYRGEWY